MERGFVMPKYSYPCVFTYDKEYHGWTAMFPDWQEFVVGSTCGRTWRQAVFMAHDLLGLMCMDREDDGKLLPLPSPKNTVSNGIVRMIDADSNAYRDMMQTIHKRKSPYRYRMVETAWKRYIYNPKWDVTQEEWKKCRCGGE